MIIEFVKNNVFKTCKKLHYYSILKFEEKYEGQNRKLIVKNITPKDFSQFSCEAKGEKCSSKLTKKTPFLEKFEQTEGPLGGIGVLQVKVRTNTHVNWYIGNKKITNKNFR